jgi:hypothetical protein
MLRSLSLAVLALALAVSFTATRATAEEQGKGTISGKVTNADGSAASGAQVRLMNPMAKDKNKGEKPAAAEDKGEGKDKERAKPVAQTTTDADGKYTLSDVPAGKYVLQAGVKNVGRATQEVEVKAGETAAVDLKLEAMKAK